MRGRLIASLVLTASLLSPASPAPSSAADQAPTTPTLDSIQKLFEQGAFEEAGRQARELVAAIERRGIAESPEGADTLDLLVELLQSRRVEADWGLSLVRRVCELRLRLEGETPAYARSLHNYGVALHRAERFEESMIQFEQVLAIRQRLLDPADVQIAATLNALGSSYGILGDWMTARDYYERALRVFALSQGLAPLGARITLFNLSELFEDMGDYAAVRELNESLLRATQGMPVATPLFQVRVHARIAEMSYRLGEDAQALAQHEEALGILESDPGQAEILAKAGTLELANTFTRITKTAWTVGRLIEAKEFCLQAIQAREGSRGTNHDQGAGDLEQLARMLHEAGDDAAALPYLERAMRIDREGPMPNSRYTIGRLTLHAAILRGLAKPDLAFESLQSALTTAVSHYGEDHPELCPILEEQARLNLATGRPEEARRRALRVEAIAARHLVRTVAWLSQGEALRYQNARLSGLDVAFSALGPNDGVASATEEVWDAVIRARGTVLDELIARRRIVATAKDPEIESIVRQLEIDRGRLAHVVVRGPADEAEGVFLHRVRSLMRNQEATERNLAARSATYRKRLADQACGWTEVRDSLPSGVALVAYVRYQRFLREGGAWKDKPSYLAFVKPAGARAQVVLLGGAEAIDALVSRWREVVADPPKIGLGPTPGTTIEASASIGDALRKAVWDPVVRRLGEERLVMVVPDGGMHQVNLAALPDGDGRFLVEAERAFHHLSSEKDVDETSRPPRGRGLLALGAPDFERGLRPSEPAGVIAHRGGSSRLVQDLPKFLPLAGARAEVEEIAGVWKQGPAEADRSEAQLLLGQTATERGLASLAPGKDIIHLATHAFVDTARMLPQPSGVRGIPPRFNPLLSSGLAMAGANSRADAGVQGMDDNDGILLGEEILSLDLSGVSWVVLSACSTGLGPIQAREGVQGLRRSFQAAGAATVITTLWEVEDSATRVWMTALYRARQQGMTTAEAMRQASRELIAEARRRERVPHPYYWGGFIATGDWR